MFLNINLSLFIRYCISVYPFIKISNGVCYPFDVVGKDQNSVIILHLLLSLQGS